MTSRPADAQPTARRRVHHVAASLRRDNAAAGVVHLVQAMVVIVLATGFALPVTASYLQGPPGTPAQDPVTLFEIPTGAAVAAFLAALGTGARAGVHRVVAPLPRRPRPEPQPRPVGASTRSRRR